MCRGWSGQAAFWISESDRALRMPNGDEVSHAADVFNSSNSCPYSFGSIGEDELSLSFEAPCSVAIRDFCEMDAAYLPGANLNLTSFGAKGNITIPALYQRVVLCTHSTLDSLGESSNIWHYPVAWLAAQRDAAALGLCPSPDIIVWPADRWSFPECSFAMGAEMQNSNIAPTFPLRHSSMSGTKIPLKSADVERWFHIQSSLSLLGICPNPELFFWFPDTITHPLCAECIQDRCKENWLAEKGIKTVDIDKKTKNRTLVTGTTSASLTCGDTARMASAWMTSQEGSWSLVRSSSRHDRLVLQNFFSDAQTYCAKTKVFSSSCPAPAIIRWLPDDFFEECTIKVIEECRIGDKSTSLRAGGNERMATRKRQDISPCNRPPFEWRSSQDLKRVIRAQNTAAAKGFCPWPSPLSFRALHHDNSTRSGNQLAQLAVGFVWNAHQRTPPRSALSARYCELPPLHVRPP